MSAPRPEPRPLAERERRAKLAATERALRVVEDDLRVIRDPWQRRNLGRHRRELRDALVVLQSTRSTDEARLNVPLARVLFERAQDGCVNPTGGKTTGRERKDG